MTAWVTFLFFISSTISGVLYVNDAYVFAIIRNSNSGSFTGSQIPVQRVQCVVIGRGEGEWESDG